MCTHKYRDTLCYWQITAFRDRFAVFPKAKSCIAPPRPPPRRQISRNLALIKPYSAATLLGGELQNALRPRIGVIGDVHHSLRL